MTDVTEVNNYVAGPNYDLNMNLAALRRQVADLGSDLARLAALHEQLLEIVKPLVYASLPGYEEESAEGEPRSDAVKTHPGCSILIAERDGFAAALVTLERVITRWRASDRCPLCLGGMGPGDAWSYSHKNYCPFANATKRMAEMAREAG